MNECVLNANDNKMHYNIYIYIYILYTLYIIKIIFLSTKKNFRNGLNTTM
jgi:hypothetical protein